MTVLKFLKKIRTVFRLTYWEIIKVWWLILPVRKDNSKYTKTFSIGIVTYINRYDKLFKPLIKNLCKLFPDVEIVIAINGYYDQEKQRKYLKEIKALLSKYPNIKYIEHNEGQSLSKLWNQLVIHSTNEKVFIFNDDVKIAPYFRKNVEDSGILKKELGLLNWSWSHFLISKRIIHQIGWFDERFPGVGNEDEDYEARLVIAGVYIESVEISGLKNIIIQTKDFSYGKHTETVNIKYVKENKTIFDKKWDMLPEPKDGYVFVRLLGKHLKLNAGMETPNFYKDF
jgi:glycosyl transferase family 2